MARAPAIGIDLGTTNSCVAVFQHGKVKILPNERGNRTTPSCVAFTHSQRLIGESAKGQITRNPANTIVDIKRAIGRSYSDVSAGCGKRHRPYEVVRESGRPNVRVEQKGDTKTFAPEEISSMVLAKMKETAESYLGVSVQSAVVSVPACFNRSQREATKDACAIAGLDVLYLINESSAAVYTYTMEKNVKVERNVLVFDLGGGKLDISIFVVEGSILEARSTCGTVSLGGEDFTTRMVDHFIEEFKVRHKRDISGNKKAVRRLCNACEKAKIELSSNSGARIEIDSLYEGIDFYTKITRVKFEELNAEIFRSILEPVEKALRDAKFDKTQIHDIVLVGGSSRIPKIQELLRGYFDGQELIKSLNPDEAVAYGAAVQAAIYNEDKSEEVQDLLLLDITPSSLGVETAGGVMTSLIKRNSTIPKKATQAFKISHDILCAAVRIFEGEGAMVKDNSFLDEIYLGPTSKEAEIEVTFDIDRRERLNVSVIDKTTGAEKRIVVTTCSSKGRLSDRDINRMREKAKKYEAEDRHEKERLSAKNDLESYVFSMQIVAERLASKCQEVTEWLEANPMAAKEEFTYWQEEMQKSALPPI